MTFNTLGIRIYSGDIAYPYSAMSQGDVVSVDIETNGLDPREAEIKTVQLKVCTNDPAILRASAATPTKLRVLMENPDILKVFHHAAFDLGFMYHHWGVRARNVRCTKVAAKLLKLPRLSYKDLVLDVLDIEIEKDQAVRLSGWDGDLSPAQIEYAVQDVEHLDALLGKLERQCSGAQGSLLRRLWAYIPTRVELEVDHGLTDVYAYK